MCQIGTATYEIAKNKRHSNKYYHFEYYFYPFHYFINFICIITTGVFDLIRDESLFTKIPTKIWLISYVITPISKRSWWNSCSRKTPFRHLILDTFFLVDVVSMCSRASRRFSSNACLTCSYYGFPKKHTIRYGVWLECTTSWNLRAFHYFP